MRNFTRLKMHWLVIALVLCCVRFSSGQTCASANAGADQTICSGSTVSLSGSIGGNATSSTWTSSGTGTFSPNASALNATYTPSLADRTAGTVTLTLTTNNPPGPCPAANDQMIVTINQPATVNAGTDNTICEGSSASLSGSIGGSASSATWSGGAGTFSPNANTLNASYTPSAAEITAGTVTLTLTTNDPAGPCPAVSDNVVITINPAATVSAGSDQTICSGSGVSLSGSISGSAASATWSTSGTGTFVPNATTLNATYNPSLADQTAGTVTLTLTTNDPAGPCPAGSDAMTVTINPAATVSAGSDDTICEGSSATLSGSIGGGASSATWSGGSGTFSPDANTLNAVYSPSSSEINSGGVVLILTTNDPAGVCPAVSDTMAIIIDAAATVNAGADTSICEGSSLQLNGIIGGAATQGTWSGGTGSFSPDANTLNAVYSPSLAENIARSATLILSTNDPAGVCSAESDTIVITIDPRPTANAGDDKIICRGDSVQLTGSIGGSATSATWTAGTGTFNPDANTLNAVYTPSGTENTSGSATLILVTNDPDGVCGAATDTIIITINPAASVNAGADFSVCAGTNAQLNGSFGGSATSVTWSGGAGSFNPDANTVNAAYTPTNSEVTAGSVTLVLTTDNPAGVCSAVSDTVVITIDPAASVNAGSDVTICEGEDVTLSGFFGGSAVSGSWSGGAGSFNPDNTTMNATYSPSSSEETAGSVTLILTTSDPSGVCPAATDTMLITINPSAFTDAGSDQTICEGSYVILYGSIGGSAVSASWSGGSGTFFPDTNTLGATYFPSNAEIAAGSATLILTTNDPAGICGAASDTMTIVINAAPVANAGSDITICEGQHVQLNGLIGGSATSATWTGGAGLFTPDASALNAVYEPIASEISAGGLTLVLTTDDPAGVCEAVSDTLQITINEAPVVNAGVDQIICEGSIVTLSGAVSGSFTSVSWSGGTGTFSPDSNSLSATYEPAASEVIAGSVTLILTSSDSTAICGNMRDTMVITINAAASVNAGSDQTICEGNNVTLNGTIGGSATSATWMGGSGVFTPDANTLNATYTPSVSEITAGTVSLVLVTDDPGGVCNAVSDTMLITINERASVNAGSDLVICEGSDATLAGSISGSAGSASWSGGTGSFSPDANTLNAMYTPSAAEVSAGSVVLILTTDDPAGVCVAASDTITITIHQAATVNAGSDQIACSNADVQLAGSIGGSASSATWSGGAGVFNPDNTTLNALYSPTTSEREAGEVTLVLTTNDPAGTCAAVSDTIVIMINSDATVNAGADIEICAGQTISLAGTVNGSSALSAWTGGSGFFADANALITVYTPSAADITAGAVAFILTGSSGSCTDSDTVIAIINSPLPVNLGNDTAITSCNGATLLLDAGSGNTYLWSNGSTSQTLLVSSTGAYAVSVTDTNGCVAADTINVSIYNDVSIDLGPDTTVCGCITLNAYVSEASYEWCDGSSYSYKNVCESGMYCVSVTNGVCTDSDTINIVVIAEPGVFLGNDTVIDDQLTLDAGGGFVTYEWSTGETTQMITITLSGVYSVTVTNQAGCTATDTIEITDAIGLPEPTDSDMLTIYPNPAKDLLTITHPDTINKISVTDLRGRLVHEFKVNSKQAILDLQKHPDGVYFIKIYTGKDADTRRIVLSH